MGDGKGGGLGRNAWAGGEAVFCAAEFGTTMGDIILISTLPGNLLNVAHNV